MGRENIPYQVGIFGVKLLQPGGKGAEMEMGWAEHDDNAAGSPLSPKDGTWSMLVQVSSSLSRLESAGGEKSSRNRTWPPTSQQKAPKGEDLSFRNQAGSKSNSAMGSAAPGSIRPKYQRVLWSVKSQAGF